MLTSAVETAASMLFFNFMLDSKAILLCKVCPLKMLLLIATGKSVEYWLFF